MRPRVLKYDNYRPTLLADVDRRDCDDKILDWFFITSNYSQQEVYEVVLTYLAAVRLPSLLGQASVRTTKQLVQAARQSPSKQGTC